MNPAEINETFREYYRELYDAKKEINSHKVNRYLDKLSIPSISNEQKEARNIWVSVKKRLDMQLIV